MSKALLRSAPQSTALSQLKGTPVQNRVLRIEACHRTGYGNVERLTTRAPEGKGTNCAKAGFAFEARQPYQASGQASVLKSLICLALVAENKTRGALLLGEEQSPTCHE